MTSADSSPPAEYTGGLALPDDLPPALVGIANEVDRIHESAMWSAQGQFEQMKLWRAMNLVLGVPAAVLAAVSAGTGLASQSVNHVPAVLALVAAGFGAALTTLNPSRRMSSAQAAANAYLEIQTSARQLLTVDLSILDRADARDHLATLTARRDEINKTADPPALFASQKARKSITGGRQSYEADKGK